MTTTAALDVPSRDRPAADVPVVITRTIRPDDLPLIAAMSSDLSQQTLYYRYFTAPGPSPPQR